MTKWTAATMLEALPEGEVIGVRLEGVQIALCRVDGQVYATGGICTHQNVRLCDGFLEGHEIECPLHQGRFDIRTGRALCPPVTVDLATYATRVDAGQVFVEIPSA